MLDRIPDTSLNMKSGLFETVELKLIIQHFINNFKSKTMITNRDVFIDGDSLSNIDDLNQQILVLKDLPR